MDDAGTLDHRTRVGEASFPVSVEWSMEQLLSLSKSDVVRMWGEAPAATLDELQGHFTGLIPNAGDASAQARALANMYDQDQRFGHWLGKAFRKTGENAGEGYNRYRLAGGRIERKLPFTTEMGSSYLDGRPALLMYYGAYRPDDTTFVDEIRKLCDNVFLGVGSRLIDGKRDPGHFLLVGPTDDWVGGAIGERFLGFTPPSR